MESEADSNHGGGGGSTVEEPAAPPSSGQTNERSDETAEESDFSIGAAELAIQMNRISDMNPADQKQTTVELLQMVRKLQDQNADLSKKSTNLERNQETIRKQFELEMRKNEEKLLEIVKKSSPEGESEKMVAEIEEALKKIEEGSQGDFEVRKAQNQVIGYMLKNSAEHAAENQRLTEKAERLESYNNSSSSRLQQVFRGFDSHGGRERDTSNRHSPYEGDRFPSEQTKGAERRVRVHPARTDPFSHFFFSQEEGTPSEPPPPSSSSSSSSTSNNPGTRIDNSGYKMPAPGSLSEKFANSNPEEYFKTQSTNPRSTGSLLENVLGWRGEARPSTY